MSVPEVLVVRTGVANTASLLAALVRVGARPRLSASAAELDAAPLVVLPGVGAFGAGMAALSDAGLCEALRRRAEAGRPLLAICLGLQLLCAGSEESPGVAGLGVIQGSPSRFEPDVQTPQMGWNEVRPDAVGGFIEPGYASFAHSYRLTSAPDGWRCARTEHGGVFISALERRGVLACQFHPELSGRWGLALIERWMSCAARESEAVRC